MTSPLSGVALPHGRNPGGLGNGEHGLSVDHSCHVLSHSVQRVNQHVILSICLVLTGVL